MKKIFYSQKVAPYLFVLPFILSFLLFFLYPVFSTILMSFQKILPGQVTYIGFKNYERLLNPHFYNALSTSARYTFWTCAILIPVPMMLAVFLDSKNMPARNIFRATFFMPILTSIIVAGTVFRLFLGEMDTAFANSVLISLGFGGWKTSSNDTNTTNLLDIMSVSALTVSIPPHGFHATHAHITTNIRVIRVI